MVCLFFKGNTVNQNFLLKSIFKHGELITKRIVRDNLEILNAQGYDDWWCVLRNWANINCLRVWKSLEWSISASRLLGVSLSIQSDDRGWTNREFTSSKAWLDYSNGVSCYWGVFY